MTELVRIGELIPAIIGGLHPPTEEGEQMSSMVPTNQAPQQETEIVTGTIQGITQKGPDKWQVEVNTGQQYTRRLWTKDANLIGQLTMMIGAPASFQCGISNWTRGDGSPVRSLWINGVGPANEAPQSYPAAAGLQSLGAQPFQAAPPGLQVGQPQVQVRQGDGRMSDAEKQPMIHRQTASKVASMLISHLPAEERTFDTLIMLCERLVAYYDHGLSGLGQAAPPAFGQDNAGDDDIPF